MRGSGSPEDPYVIEGWCIQAPTSVLTGIVEAYLAGILIHGTDAHVQIQEVFVYGVPHTEHRVYGVPVDQVTRGMVVARASNVSIVGSTVAYHEQGIAVDRSRNVRLAENVARDNTQNGIWSDESDEIVVEGNLAVSNSASGIFANQAHSHAIRDNVVTRNHREGIRANFDLEEGTVVGNLAFHNRDGIIDTSDQGVSIHRNVLVDNEILGFFSAGRNTSFHNNTVVDNGLAGVATAFTEHNLVEHNLVEGHTLAGVFLGWRSVNTTVRANNITDNADGIQFERAISGVVHGNNIWNNTGWGLDVVSAKETVNATGNWWGCPDGPSADACDGVVGDAVVEPWLEEPNPRAGVKEG